MPGSTASRSSSNHTNPKPGGLRATQASLIWPKSRKKSRRSRASASGGKLPTKTCAARECPRSSARPRGAAQEKSAAFCRARASVHGAQRGPSRSARPALPWCLCARHLHSHRTRQLPTAQGGSAAPGRVLPSAPLTHWIRPVRLRRKINRFLETVPYWYPFCAGVAASLLSSRSFCKGFHRPLSRAWREGQ